MNKSADLWTLAACVKNAYSALAEEFRDGWSLFYDGSVGPIELSIAEALGHGHDETVGIPFEFTSPGPPNALTGVSGLQRTLRKLAVLTHVGIQSSRRASLHVHMNVGDPTAGGSLLNARHVAYVWTAYIKYQFAIDELLSPGRVGNVYAERLLLGRYVKPAEHEKEGCHHEPERCMNRFFLNVHDFLSSRKTVPDDNRDDSAEELTTFCNAALQMPHGSIETCLQKYPSQRYFQVNLVPLHKFKTMEFRGHSATYDPDRVSRWILFLSAFVQRFGLEDDMQQYFDADGISDLKKLSLAQVSAISSELFEQLHELLDPSTYEYYTLRKWEVGKAGCFPDIPYTLITPVVHQLQRDRVIAEEFYRAG